MRSFIATFLAVLLCACPQQQGTPAVSISAHPFAIDDMGQSTTLNISAQDALGNPGTGSVTLSSGAGTVADTSVKLDSSGSATSHFSCNVTSDIKCSGRVIVTASWNGQSSTTHVQVGDAGIITGTGGGTAAGGGMGGGGGPDSGTGGGGSEPDGGPDSGMGGGTASTDGGMDAGPPDDAGPPAAFDAGSVLLLGTLTPGTTQYAVASLGKPSSALVGVPPGTELLSAQLNAAGQLVYWDPTTYLLNVVVPDDYGINGSGSSYPANPEANDQTIDTTVCGSSPVLDFWARPDSMSVVYQCAGDAGYFEDTTPLLGLKGFRVVAAGFKGSLLILDSMGQGYTADDAGHHPVFGFSSGETMASLGINHRDREVRATDGGYWVMRASMNNEATGPCDLYFVSNAGAATFAGLYTDLNVGTTSISCTGRLDSSGVLYTPVQLSSDFAVQRRPQVLPNGTSSTVYTTSGAPMSNFGTRPPHVFTFFDTNSTLVTGP